MLHWVKSLLNIVFVWGKKDNSGTRPLPVQTDLLHTLAASGFVGEWEDAFGKYKISEEKKVNIRFSHVHRPINALTR